jgi:mannose-6-phosphate isomerase-like protein (cupin superfamily)
MQTIDRRTLLSSLGIASITPLLGGASAGVTRKAVAVQPGENRFPYAAPEQARGTPCKVTKEDSAGLCSIFELLIPARSGPPLHVHHREDEWFYVLSGDFVFEVDAVKYPLPIGGSIWAPRDLPHRFANMTTADARLILVCQPGGFESFWDEVGKKTMEKLDPAQMNQYMMARWGMEMLGPPLL